MHLLSPTITQGSISVDGGPMPGFPDARRDNGIATTLKVTGDVLELRDATGALQVSFRSAP